MMHESLPPSSVTVGDESLIQIPPAHVLAKAFPCYLEFDRETKIIQMGNVLQELYPMLVKGSLLQQHFQIKFQTKLQTKLQTTSQTKLQTKLQTKPPISNVNSPLDLDVSQISTNAVLILESLQDGMQLRGQIIFAAKQETFFFLGSPWIGAPDTLQALHQKLVEPSLQDTITDLLFLLQARSTSLAGTKQLAEKLTGQRMQLQRALSQAELAMAVLEQAAEAIEITDADARLLYVNSAFETITGYSREAVIGKTPVSLFRAKQQDPLLYDRIWQIVSGGKVWQGSLVSQRQDGALYHEDATIFPVLNRHGKITNYVSIKRDVSDRKKTQTQLEHSLALLQATFEAVADGILVVDTQGRITNFNQKFIDLWQIPESLSGCQKYAQVTQYIASQLKDPVQFSTKQLIELYVRSASENQDLIELKDGRIFERYASPQQRNGNVIGWVWSFRDVTERQQQQAKIRYQALYDALTGLPNRTLFQDRLAVALRNARRNSSTLAVMFLDLDYFKQVNDTFGHAIGDQLLQGVAQRLLTCLREGDTVARWSGDEFTLMLPNIQTVENATAIAARILASLREPLILEGNHCQVGSSIGIAFYPADGETPAELLQNADAALYQVKKLSRNTYQVYNATMGMF